MRSIQFILALAFPLIALAFFPAHKLHGQDKPPTDVTEFREELNRAYADKEESPLSKRAIRKFDGHQFFPYNDSFRVQAQFIKFENPETFRISTSSGKMKTYDKYAKLLFEIGGEAYELMVYQSHRLRETEEYKDYLFLPFKDFTNGITSYGGGRYIDLRIPEGEEILLDFNQSYNPYCAYSFGYSCPIPPDENHLSLQVNAGILKPAE